MDSLRSECPWLTVFDAVEIVLGWYYDDAASCDTTDIYIRSSCGLPDEELELSVATGPGHRVKIIMNDKLVGVFDWHELARITP